jgi:hypothetical protein
VLCIHRTTASLKASKRECPQKHSPMTPGIPHWKPRKSFPTTGTGRAWPVRWRLALPLGHVFFVAHLIYFTLDGLNTSGMFLSGLIMVTRNRYVAVQLLTAHFDYLTDICSLRYLAWPSVAFGISGLTNSHPLRAKDGSGGAWSSVL